MKKKTTWLEDYRLVQKSLSGDQTAWKVLYDNAYTIVHNYTRKIYKLQYIGVDELEDVIAEAFARCYRKRNEFLGKSKFSTWVCGFVRYILLGYYHQRIVANKLKYTLLVVEPTYEYKNPEMLLIQKEQNQCIGIAFQSLTIKHQWLIKCYVLGEVKPREVSKLTYSRYIKRQEELKMALCILRKRYCFLYKNLYRF